MSKTKQPDSKNTFILKPIRSDTCYKSEIKIDYTPIYSEYTHKNENIVPTLNFDQKPYFPGFLIEHDKSFIEQNIDKYQEDHQKKIYDYTNKKQELYEPKPGRKYKYCGVCKLPYDEYITHVQSQAHKYNYSQNFFAQQISKMSQEIHMQNVMNQQQQELEEQPPQILQVKQNSSREILTENLSTTIEDDYDPEVIIIDSNNNNSPVKNPQQISIQSVKKLQCRRQIKEAAKYLQLKNLKEEYQDISQKNDKQRQSFQLYVQPQNKNVNDDINKNIIFDFPGISNTKDVQNILQKNYSTQCIKRKRRQKNNLDLQDHDTNKKLKVIDLTLDDEFKQENNQSTVF